jgi:acetyl-CoA synthetase
MHRAVLAPPRRRRHHLADYREVYAAFTWGTARRALAGLPRRGGLNLAHEAVDRHGRGRGHERVALRVIGRGGEPVAVSFGELAELSSRFANALRGLGVGPGERIFALLERGPELHAVALGAWKCRAIFAPLYAAFGPEPLRQRLTLGDARVLVVGERLYAKRIAALRGELPSLAHVVVVRDGDDALPAGTLDYGALLAAGAPRFDIPPTSPEDPAILLFTSGTTGTPKGVVHVHDAAVTHFATGRYVLDLQADDVFWCTADPGWVTGTSYGIVAPLLQAVPSIVFAGEFDPEAWYRLIERERVTVWYTTPTALRLLMRAGTALARRFDLTSLRLVASVGEALNPEVVRWGEEAFDLPVLDNWWQTETGGIMIANYPAVPVRPGSMGLPVPGIDAAIVKRRTDGGVDLVADDETGEIALRAPWPSMFRGYLGMEERYRSCFADGWYLSGDLARRDADGYFWFVGRSDDVIKTMGHLVGPFEVESVLLEHPAVAEAAVIGKPDAIAGELIHAFVTLRPGHEPGEAMASELLAHARRRLGAAVAPKQIDFAAELPRTRSGKLMRRLLRARLLGLPEGDLSTLERGE